MSRTTDLSAGGPATFGMRLLIFSLSVLFLAGLVGYLITRQRLGSEYAVTLPTMLYGSTAAILVTGGFLEMAWQRLRRGSVQPASVLLRLAVVAALVFLVFQVPALTRLLAGHRAAVVEGNPLLGFVFFLVLLHALHVVGGLAAMAVVVARSLGRSLNPDQDGATVRLTARYWHFLDVVWVVLFAVFLGI